MARAPYALQIYRLIPLESANGTTYTATIWTTYAAGSAEYRLAANGLKIDWESDSVQDKNSPILASKLTMDVMVEDATQELELDGFSDRPEKDVWVKLADGLYEKQTKIVKKRKPKKKNPYKQGRPIFRGLGSSNRTNRGPLGYMI